jgi:hypothetical protein
VSYDARIVGGHQFHTRHPDLQALSERALKLIIQRFHNDATWIGKMDQSGGVSPWGKDVGRGQY